MICHGNKEVKPVHDLDEKIHREKDEVRELEDVLKREKEELHELEKEREAEHHHHPQVIDVNTREIEYFRYTYTVEYSKGPEQNPKGSLTDNGKKILVKNKMLFDVERADKS